MAYYPTSVTLFFPITLEVAYTNKLETRPCGSSHSFTRVEVCRNDEHTIRQVDLELAPFEPIEHSFRKKQRADIQSDSVWFELCHHTRDSFEPGPISPWFIHWVLLIILTDQHATVPWRLFHASGKLDPSSRHFLIQRVYRGY